MTPLFFTLKLGLITDSPESTGARGVPLSRPCNPAHMPSVASVALRLGVAGLLLSLSACTRPSSPVAGDAGASGSYVRRDDPEVVDGVAHHPGTPRSPNGDEPIRCDGADALQLHGSSCHYATDNALVAPGEYPYAYDGDAGSLLDIEDGGAWWRWPMHWAAAGVRCSEFSCFVDRSVYPEAGVYDMGDAGDLFVDPGDGRWTRGSLFTSTRGEHYVCFGSCGEQSVDMGAQEWCPGAHFSAWNESGSRNETHCIHGEPVSVWTARCTLYQHGDAHAFDGHLDASDSGVAGGRGR